MYFNSFTRYAYHSVPQKILHQSGKHGVHAGFCVRRRAVGRTRGRVRPEARDALFFVANRSLFHRHHVEPEHQSLPRI